MLANAVIYTFPAEKADEAAALLTKLAALSRREPGCRQFEACRSNDDPRVFVLFERWNDAAALEAHIATDHFQTFGINGVRKLAESRVAHRCTPLGE